MRHISVTGDVDIDLEQAIDDLDENQLLRLRELINDRLAPSPEELASVQNMLAKTFAKTGPGIPRMVVTRTEDIALDLDDVITRLCKDDLLELRETVNSELYGVGSIEKLYYACRDGDREKVFELARSICMDALGRVC